MKRALLLLLPACACAQGFIQNSDIFAGFGGIPAKAQTVPGTAVTLSSAVALTASFTYGYQISHWSAASLWVELPIAFTVPHQRTSILPGTIELDSTYVTTGLRIMVPLQARVSVFGVAGGGGGFYSNPILQPVPPPTEVGSTSVVHGTFDFGGGMDLRVNRHFSIRVELRDYLSGHGLGGTAGINHLLPVAGLAYHL